MAVFRDLLPGYGGDAVAITAQVTLQPGDSIDLPADALRNGIGEHLLIDAFRWSIDAADATSVSDPPTASTLGVTGAAVEVMIQIGDKPLTASFVPLYCLDISRGQDVEENFLAVATGTNTETLFGSQASGAWIFDEPLSLHPGDAVSVRLTHKQITSLPITVSLALTGRSGGENESSPWIPYVASWTSPAVNPNDPTVASPVIITSTERDLINRCGSDLEVSRFIGRILRQGVVCTPVATNIPNNAEQVFPGVQSVVSQKPLTAWFPGAVDAAVTATIRDSAANDNVPFPLTFRQIFDPETRSLEALHTLDSSAYYIVQITVTPPAVIDAQLQAAISMVGVWKGA